jgi:hypothetical protein
VCPDNSKHIVSQEILTESSEQQQQCSVVVSVISNAFSEN